MTATSSTGRVALSYETIRNLTSPEEKENGAKSYFANIPVFELLKLDTEANLRGYIPEHPGKKRTQCHRSIGDTLRFRSDRFIQLSSGITISATDIQIDDNAKVAVVTNGSIINGAQTQGEFRLFQNELAEAGEAASVFHVRVELMIDPEREFIIEAAIARNTSTNIQRISMAGKKRYFDDMDASFQRMFKTKSLARSETDTGDDFVDTLRLLQILWAMMPEDLLPSGKRSTSDARLKSYKNRAFCLGDFEKDFCDSRDGNAPASARYKYFVDMAGVAWKEYLKWRHHLGWAGRRLRITTKAIRRSKTAKNGYVVADGVIFPILSAMALFVQKDPVSGKYDLSIPGVFDESDMIEAARDQLTAHNGNPMSMGRNAAVYEALTSLSRMTMRFEQRMAAAAQ